MKKRGSKIIVAAIIYILALILPFSNELINKGMFLISYIIVGLIYKI